MYGCAAGDEPVAGLRFEGSFADGGDTRVTASVDEAAGVSRVSWNRGDAIGIFSDRGHENVPYVSVSDASHAVFRPAGEVISDGTVFAAYYPYAETAAGGMRSIRGGVPDRQSFVSGDNVSKMFMRAAAGISDEGSVSLCFENMFSVLEFGLKGSAVLASMEIEADVPIAAGAEIDLLSGTVGTPDGESGSIVVDFGPDGLALSASPVYVPVGVMPFRTSGAVTLTFTDMSGARFRKVIWSGGMEVGANCYVRQPLAAMQATDFSAAELWSDDFKDVRLPDSDLFGELVSGSHSYYTEGVFGIVSGQLRVGTKTKYACLTISSILPESRTADLTVEISARALSSSVAVEFGVKGSGALSAGSVTVDSSAQYETFSVDVFGADSSTRLEIGGAGFYLGSLRITERM